LHPDLHKRIAFRILVLFLGIDGVKQRFFICIAFDI